MKTHVIRKILSDAGTHPEVITVLVHIMADLRTIKDEAKDQAAINMTLLEGIRDLAKGFGVMTQGIKNLEPAMDKVVKDKRAREIIHTEDVDMYSDPKNEG